MNEHVKTAISAEERKAKIRQRYKGISRDELEVRPAIQPASFQDDTSEKRVAVYARVSTGDPNQTSSYELQKNHYQDMVSRHPGWNLVHIYADEGISGTSLKHRDEFIKMIAACEAGQIDLIVTKSVSRFARNVLDCIGKVRELAALPKPVGVFFETENIYTLNSNSEMSLSFISTLAQEESHTKSEIMNASIEMRFSRGIFLTPELLGYDKDSEGNLIVNQEEALTVRLIFFMFLYGYGCTQIAETLMELGRLTKPGNTKWTAGTVMNVLQNERYCGDILARKTYTPNYLDHRSKKNRQNRNQYYQRDHHEPIITRDDFIATQRMIENAKYGHRGLLPYLHVIETGALQGFVELNPRWAGFKKQDYFSAVEEILADNGNTIFNYHNKEVQAGEFDLRGYEIARVQFFQSSGDLSVTFSIADIQFSKACIRKLNNPPTVELLFDPNNHLFAVRPIDKNNRHAIFWATIYSNSTHARKINGSAFLPVMYDILGWKPENKYRIRGIRRQRGNESILMFDLHETEVFIPISTDEHTGEIRRQPFDLFDEGTTPITSRGKKSVVAFPEAWARGFGANAYQHEQAREVAAIDRDGQWNINQAGTPYQTEKELQPSSTDALVEGINSILNHIQQEETNE